MTEDNFTLIGRSLTNVVSLVEFECNGEPVQVDQIARERGVSSLVTGRKSPHIHYKSSISYKFDAPLIYFIQRLLEWVLHHFVLVCEGKVVEVDGFRLKHIGRWRNSRPQPLFNSLGSFNGHCNLRCKFCYDRGNGLPSLDRARLTLEEARTRIRHYDKEKRKGIIFPINHYREPFTNPDLIEILRLARQKSPDEEFYFYTNGTMLTKEIIEQLSELRPVDLGVSLNSANPLIRRELMGDPDSETAIESIRWLYEYRLRFEGSIVAWPTIPLDDITNTILYLDQWQAVSIVVHLPGYNKYLPEEMQFDTDAVWPRVVSHVKQLRSQVKTPILFSIGPYATPSITPIIEGIYRNSPAQRAGLQIGDRILSVNGKEMFTKLQTLRSISDLAQNKEPVRINFQRDGEKFDMLLKYDCEIDDDWYPFKPAGYPDLPPVALGIHLSEDFLVDYLITLLRLQRQKNADSVLLFSTPFIKPLLFQVLAAKSKIRAALEGMDLRIEIAPNHFWGGNICLGDLNMVQDFIDHLKNKVLVDKSYRPDLIVIPSSFALKKGFDLAGVSFLEIERQLDIPVELLPCYRIAP